MNIYYRISNNSTKAKRLEWATKEVCLRIFLSEFNDKDNKIVLALDHVIDPNLLKLIEQLKHQPNIEIDQSDAGSDMLSFKYILTRAIEEANDKVFFAEDDYLYLPQSNILLNEGLEISNYVTLYDHPDKYLNAVDGGNPQITNNGEITRLIKTKSSHWKYSNSTTMTFASNVKVLKEDLDIWLKHLKVHQTHCHDYEAFCELIQIKGHTLISSLPGRSTHCEINSLSPFIDWNSLNDT